MVYIKTWNVKCLMYNNYYECSLHYISIPILNTEHRCCWGDGTYTLISAT